MIQVESFEPLIKYQPQESAAKHVTISETKMTIRLQFLQIPQFGQIYATSTTNKYENPRICEQIYESAHLDLVERFPKLLVTLILPIMQTRDEK